jgi:DNA-directed RNA polymerase specialized sigma24 family protein
LAPYLSSAGHTDRKVKVPDQSDLQTLPLGGIAQRCTRETALFFQRRSHDPRFCYELFRRAFLERNQRAWELIYTEYHALVSGWVERHPAFPTSGEETQYFVNRAFEKMWLALSSDKFTHFPDLKSLLRYLQMCVHSAILDSARTAEQAEPDADIDTVVGDQREPAAGVDDEALAHVQRQELWQQISLLLHGEKERRVVYGTFALALKPQELCTLYPDTFADADEVYTVKQNVLARLRRSSELRKFLNPDA